MFHNGPSRDRKVTACCVLVLVISGFFGAEGECQGAACNRHSGAWQRAHPKLAQSQYGLLAAENFMSSVPRFAQVTSPASAGLADDCTKDLGWPRSSTGAGCSS